jgi:Flp pilus assembly protein CpaB
MAASRKVLIILGLAAGLGVGAVGTGLLAGVVSYSVVRLEEKRVQRAWNLVPVMVASREFAPGDTLTYDRMAQRLVPEQLVTASLVKPDSAAYVTDQVFMAPLLSGDPLHWALFLSARQMPGPQPASPRDAAVWAACDAALATSPTAPKRERTPADIRARLLSEARP